LGKANFLEGESEKDFILYYKGSGERGEVKTNPSPLMEKVTLFRKISRKKK